MVNPPVNPRSIRGVGGVRKFLDLPENRAIHNGNGSTELIRYGLGERRLTHTDLAKMYNVRSVNTIKNWLFLIKREVENEASKGAGV